VPRLTNNDYVIQRDFLKDDWNEFRAIYAFLDYTDQLVLHEFYGPSKDWSDEEAIAHRKRVTKQQPSLPNRAGKLYAQIDRHAKDLQKRLAEQPTQPAKVKIKRLPQARGKIRVSSVIARPEPDLRKLAMVLLDVARDMEKEQARKEERRAA
jgi:hypothetical protein